MSNSAAAESLYCPHLQEVDNRTLQQLFSKVAAVRSEDRELFDFTHRRIEVFRSAGSDQQTVHEEDVYEQFSVNRMKNFAVVIEGEVGTGKSELCAYLAHQLKDDGRPLLHVDKEDDLMTLLSERIPTFYREQFGEELPGAADFQELQEAIEAMPHVVANSAVSNAILNLAQRGYEMAVTDEQSTEISEFIEEKLALFVESGEYATEVKFLSEQEYQQNDCLHVFADLSTEDAVEALNEELWRAVRNRYDTASLSDVLKRVGAQFTDTRPVLVFEDFSITAMEANKLASFIESDSTENAWDFIIAGTRDSTGPLHTQTAESRYEFYQTNASNSPDVLFLGEDSAVDFVRPYLGYFKSFDGSVEYRTGSSEAEYELAPAPPDSRCAECDLCDEPFRDLFPFNEQFLYRMYVGMEPDQRSPREYIMAVFDVLSDYYEGKISAPSDAQRLKPLVNRMTVADKVYDTAEPFAHLARWYGVATEDGETIKVDRRFPEAFGLVEPGTDSAELPAPLEATNDEIIVPSSEFGVEEGGRSGTDNQPGEEDDGPDSPTPVQTDPVETEFDAHAPIIEPWLNKPQKFKETTQHLERGLEATINQLTDDYALFEGTSLRYNLSSQKSPFVFSITEETPEADQIVIDPTEFQLSDLRSVLRYGIERDEIPRTADDEALLSECGTQLTAYAREWRSLIQDANLYGEDILYQQRANYGFEDFVPASYSYVVMLGSPWEPVSADVICDRFGTVEHGIDPDIEAWLQEELDYDQSEAVRDLVDAAPQLEAMVGELFGVSGSDLDLIRVRSWFEEHTPRDVLSKLGRGYISNIEFRVQFGDGPVLQDVADTAYDVRVALDDVSHRYQRAVVADIERNLTELSMDELDQLVGKLDTYDVDPDVMEPLKRFDRLEQSQIEDAVAAAAMADERYGTSEFQSIQASLASAKLANSEVYQRFEAVPLNADGGPSHIGAAFLEVATHYAE